MVRESYYNIEVLYHNKYCGLRSSRRRYRLMTSCGTEIVLQHKILKHEKHHHAHPHASSSASLSSGNMLGGALWCLNKYLQPAHMNIGPARLY